MPKLNSIDPHQLLRLLGTQHAPALIDVCIDADFAADPYIIPTARRWPFDRITDLADDLQDTRVVVICQKGLKLSHGAAAMLRSQGIAAEVLEGGMLGLTRHRPKIDRIACPWLIRRFVDPKAQFLFVPPNEVLQVAEKFNAHAFDVEGAEWTDLDGRCTFDAMLKAFELNYKPLETMAQVIRAADMGQLDSAPEAAGLLALSIGLSKMHSDDLAQLEAGLPLYDALFRWARDGRNETHGHTA